MSTLQVDRITPYLSASVTIDGDVIQANAATTGSNTFVGDQNIQGTITASIQEGFVLAGGVGDVSKLVATSSFGGGSGFPFTGNAVITGSLTISGSSAVDLTVIGTQTITGSLLLSSSVGLPFSNTNGTIQQYFGNTFGGNIGIFQNSNSTEIGLALDGAEWTTNWGNGPLLYVNNTPGDTYEGVFGFQDKTNYTDGRITALKPLDVRGNTTITGSLTISGSSAVDLRVVGNQTVSGSVDVSGSVKQRFNAPALGSQTDLVVVNGATINGVPFNQQAISIQNYDFGVDSYKNAFVIEAWDSTSYNFGGELLLNGETAQFAVVASGSSGDFGTKNGSIAILDNGNSKTKAVLTGQIVEIGGGGIGFQPTIAESITIGRSAIQTVVSGSVGIEKVLTLAPQDPLPANGIGQLAVSGSNLYYNDGSTWTQIN